jgi:hypothetical protein
MYTYVKLCNKVFIYSTLSFTDSDKYERKLHNICEADWLNIISMAG